MGNPRKSSNSNEDLHLAARNGDLNTVESICISNPLAVNSRDKHSRTPLHLAAWSGQTEVVSYLCMNKADAGAAAMDDMGAIHFASQKGHLEIVRILISSGVSVKACNRKGLTPLHYAVQGSHLDLIKYLIKRGANPTARTKAGKCSFDLATSEEVRSILVEWEKSAKKTDPIPLNKKDEESVLEDEVVESDGATEASHREDDRNRNKKRKGEEAETKGTSSETKKAKVVPSHLITAYDVEEDEEENA